MSAFNLFTFLLCIMLGGVIGLGTYLIYHIKRPAKPTPLASKLILSQIATLIGILGGAIGFAIIYSFT